VDGRVERLPLSSPVLVGMVVLAVPPERQGLPTSAQGRSAQTGVPRSVIAAAFAAGVARFCTCACACASTQTPMKARHGELLLDEALLMRLFGWRFRRGARSLQYMYSGVMG